MNTICLVILGIFDLLFEGIGLITCNFIFDQADDPKPSFIIYSSVALDVFKFVFVLSGFLLIWVSERGIDPQDRYTLSAIVGVTEVFVSVPAVALAVYIVVVILQFESHMINYRNIALIFSIYAAVKLGIFLAYSDTLRNYIKERPRDYGYYAYQPISHQQMTPQVYAQHMTPQMFNPYYLQAVPYVGKV